MITIANAKVMALPGTSSWEIKAKKKRSRLAFSSHSKGNKKQKTSALTRDGASAVPRPEN